MQHLLDVVNPALLITFLPCGQSTFMQCYVYSVALHKRLICAPVHAGILIVIIVIIQAHI